MQTKQSRKAKNRDGKTQKAEVSRIDKEIQIRRRAKHRCLNEWRNGRTRHWTGGFHTTLRKLVKPAEACCTTESDPRALPRAHGHTLTSPNSPVPGTVHRVELGIKPKIAMHVPKEIRLQAVFSDHDETE